MKSQGLGKKPHQATKLPIKVCMHILALRPATQQSAEEGGGLGELSASPFCLPCLLAGAGLTACIRALS